MNLRPLQCFRPRLCVALAPLILAGMAAGCGRVSLSDLGPGLIDSLTGTELGGPSLRIATCWPKPEREAVELAFKEQNGFENLRLVWIELPDGSRLSRMSAHIPTIDVFLGGPLSEYERLARSGKLLSIEEESSKAWCVARRSNIEKAEVQRRSWTERPALDDPRVNPVALTWAESQLRSHPWRDGYALLVRAFGRGELPSDTAAVTDPLENSSKVVYEEGAAIAQGTRNEAAARAFVRFIASRTPPGDEPPSPPVEPDVSGLVADLLGATLVDAREELAAVWESVDRKGEAVPAGALRWLNEPPPWPPASVEKLQSRGGDRALAMVHDLAEQIAPDPEVRFSLVRSWLGPRRLVDRSVLLELSRAAGGRLVHEPRFRAWLRGEWTAWARQRYRRVARLVELAGARITVGP